MKKVTVVFFILSLLASLLCVSSVSVAEEPFSIRTNVQFGDSIETVRTKDDAVKDAPVFNFVDKEYPEYLSGKVELAGLKATLDYCFDDSGLKEINYIIIKDIRDATNVTPVQFLGAYHSLKQSLIEKYGPTLDKSDVRCTVLVGNRMKAMYQPTINGVDRFLGLAFVLSASWTGCSGGRSWRYCWRLQHRQGR